MRATFYVVLYTFMDTFAIWLVNKGTRTFSPRASVLIRVLSIGRTEYSDYRRIELDLHLSFADLEYVTLMMKLMMLAPVRQWKHALETRCPCLCATVIV